jgi:hypothetical protein
MSLVLSFFFFHYHLLLRLIIELHSDGVGVEFQEWDPRDLGSSFNDDWEGVLIGQWMTDAIITWNW